jgi:hypothetical protein
MRGTMTNDISATFDTRRAAELAVEHLVQEHGVARSDITVDAEGAANSSGTERSGADAGPDATASDRRPKLKGAIRVSVRSDEGRRKVIEAVLHEAGGQGAT